MHILGLDLAKVTGVAKGATSGPWFFGTIEIGGSGAAAGVDYFNFQKQLREEIREWKPDVVVFEEVEYPMRVKGGGLAVYAFRTNVALCTLVMTTCESLGVPYVSVGVNELKKFAGAAGHRSKTDDRDAKQRMKDAARAKLFGKVIPGAMPVGLTGDQIDAAWAAAYGLEKVDRRQLRRSA